MTNALSLQVVRYDSETFFQPHYDTSESEDNRGRFAGRRATTCSFSF